MGCEVAQQEEYFCGQWEAALQAQGFPIRVYQSDGWGNVHKCEYGIPSKDHMSGTWMAALDWKTGVAWHHRFSVHRETEEKLEKDLIKEEQKLHAKRREVALSRIIWWFFRHPRYAMRFSRYARATRAHLCDLHAALAAKKEALSDCALQSAKTAEAHNEFALRLAAALAAEGWRIAWSEAPAPVWECADSSDVRSAGKETACLQRMRE